MAGDKRKKGTHIHLYFVQARSPYLSLLVVGSVSIVHVFSLHEQPEAQADHDWIARFGFQGAIFRSFFVRNHLTYISCMLNVDIFLFSYSQGCLQEGAVHWVLPAARDGQETREKTR